MTKTATTHATDLGASATLLPPLSALSSADEINHRIANSLQLLSALVSVQARTIEDPLALAALDITRGRIAAIANVHRQLYQAREATRVELGAYLKDLGGDLEAACAHAASGRRVVVAAASLTVSAEDATAIGIIVSELVTNACKYAYAPEAPGDVTIGLRAGPCDGYVLEIEDRGRGMAGAVRGAGLGERLVEMMAVRLGGRYDYRDAQPGTRFTLRVGQP
ncbi:sensor histidine kinase [Caulobacter segnis]